MHPVSAPSPASRWYPLVDPVCGRQIEPVPIAWHVTHGGEDYYFCSVRCAERFRIDPDAHLQRQALRLTAHLAGT